MARVLLALLLAAALWAPSLGARAAEPRLQVKFLGDVRNFDAATLLARPDVRSITVPNDIAYRREMQFRAVPLLTLLDGLPLEGADTMETRATDGFVSQLPMSLVLKAKSGGSVPWLAVEDPGAPWPMLAGKSHSAGPFYIVWLDPQRSGVRSEQWPYALAAITEVEAPAQRWPQIAVDPALPADDPARHGEAAYIVQCLPCHRIRGGGEGDMGPDLAVPQSPTEYMTHDGLVGQIRDPKSLRSWPAQKMPGFDKAALPAADVEAIIAYLQHMAHRRDAPPDKH